MAELSVKSLGLCKPYGPVFLDVLDGMIKHAHQPSACKGGVVIGQGFDLEHGEPQILVTDECEILR